MTTALQTQIAEKKDQLFDLMAAGIGMYDAAVQVDWSPAELERHMASDPVFARRIADVDKIVASEAETALYRAMREGRQWAVIEVLRNRAPERWADRKQVDVKHEHGVDPAAVQTVQAGIIAHMRAGGDPAALQAPIEVESEEVA